MAFQEGNTLLDALPASVVEPIFRNAAVVSLERNDRTMWREHAMQNVDFPLTALMAVYGTLDDGMTVEIVNVGREGFIEVDAGLDLDVALRHASCQFAGTVLRIPLGDFQRALSEVREFGTRVRHSIRARQFVTEQNVICNLRHTVHQRLARWLLLVCDRLGAGPLQATHEFMGAALGAQRASISLAAAHLKASGSIDYDRGSIRIADRALLTHATCECYHAMSAAIALSVR